jgi:hypothetical protein
VRNAIIGDCSRHEDEQATRKRATRIVLKAYLPEAETLQADLKFDSRATAAALS